MSAPSDEKPAERDIDRARRRLLAALVYAAPVIVGSVVVKTAHGQVVSCAPNTCKPIGGDLCGPIACTPRENACNPNACAPLPLP